MSTGALLLPPGYHPLIDGAVVTSGKLYFYRTITTTAQDTYTDSSLSTPNANPVILNATGGLDTLVYGDPSTGFNYRMRVYSSADVLLGTHDDLVVFGNTTATYSEGSFTATLTGYASGPTGTVTYKIFANSAGTGKFCVLHAASGISGTSNSTSFTMTGIPAAAQPSASCNTELFVATDNGALVSAFGSVSGGTMTFYTDEPLSATGWTGSGNKALPGNWMASYVL